VGDAVLGAQSYIYFEGDSEVTSKVGFYPTTAGGLTLSYLLSETRNSAAFEAMIPKVMVAKRDWITSLFA
jgi:hypothetical protein